MSCVSIEPTVIVVNAFSARIGGGQTYLKHILANIPSSCRVRVYVFCPDELVGQMPVDERLTFAATRWPTTNPISRLVWERLLLPSFLRRVGASILFCPGGIVNTTAPHGCRVVTMFRNMLPFDDQIVRTSPWGLNKLRNILLRRSLLKSFRHADLTIFISEFARATIEKLVSPRRAVTIPHGIDDSFRAPVTIREGGMKPPEFEYIIYVSRFESYKHHDKVVEGYSSLQGSLREQYKLLLVGENYSEEAQAVRKMIDSLGLSGDVIVVGKVPYADLPAWYSGAAVILFASSCENCPNILLESLAAGRPVASSSVLPMPEFGGSDIAYFDPRSSDAIRDALERLLLDERFAQGVAAAAKERSRMYSWRTTAERTWTEILALV